MDYVTDLGRISIDQHHAERSKQRDNLTLIAWLALVLITAPVWIIPGAIYMIATGNTPRTLGRESNEVDE